MTTARTRFAAGPAKMTATRFHVGARQYASGASESWISVRPRSAERCASGETAASGSAARTRSSAVAGAGVVALVEMAPEVADRPAQRRRLLDRTAEVDVEVARGGPVHARDLHVAAERDRSDAVLDPVPLRLHDRGREAEIELARVHPDAAGDEEVARLVDEDQEREPEQRDEDTHPTSTPRPASRRASASASTSSARSRAGAPSAASSVASTTSAIPRNGRRCVEECGDRHLVGGVEHGRVRPARLAGAARKREQGERLQVGRCELERHAGGQVELRHVGRSPIRVREREGDGNGHVRVAKVRERCTVAEAGERVDDRGRVDHDLDLLVRDAEEEVRFDQLQPLVGERRRVDRDLRAHAPGRVRERVLDRHALEVVAAAAAEGPARRGQHERVDRSRLATFEALEERGVLRVDGKQQTSAPLFRLARQVACSDQALLVRERERDAALERPERRADSGEADDRVQDDVRLGGLEQLGHVASYLRMRDAVLAPPARSGRTEPTRARKARARGSAPRPRSPAGRSSRWRRAALSASRSQCALRQG